MNLYWIMLAGKAYKTGKRTVDRPIIYIPITSSSFNVKGTCFFNLSVLKT